MLWFAGFLLLQAVLCRGDSVTAARTRLVGQLLDQYESTRASLVIPAESMSVKVGISLNSASYDKGVLHSDCYLHHSWQDTRLAWNPEDYEGITQIYIPAKMIWRPDITVYSSLSPNIDMNYDLNVIVFSEGTVLWIPPARLDTPCPRPPKSAYVECEIKLGSWTYDGNRMDIEFANEEHNIDMSGYKPNYQFSIGENVGVRTNKHYPCCEEPYPNIAFTLGLKLKRD